METMENKENYQKNLLEQHMSEYYKVLAVQPRRHTEEQMRLERERETLEKRTVFQQELHKLRDQYKREIQQLHRRCHSRDDPPSNSFHAVPGEMTAAVPPHVSHGPLQAMVAPSQAAAGTNPYSQEGNCYVEQRQNPYDPTREYILPREYNQPLAERELPFRQSASALPQVPASCGLAGMEVSNSAACMPALSTTNGPGSTFHPGIVPRKNSSLSHSGLMSQAPNNRRVLIRPTNHAAQQMVGQGPSCSIPQSEVAEVVLPMPPARHSYYSVPLQSPTSHGVGSSREDEASSQNTSVVTNTVQCRPQSPVLSVNLQTNPQNQVIPQKAENREQVEAGASEMPVASSSQALPATNFNLPRPAGEHPQPSLTLPFAPFAAYQPYVQHPGIQGQSNDPKITQQGSAAKLDYGPLGLPVMPPAVNLAGMYYPNPMNLCPSLGWPTGGFGVPLPDAATNYLQGIQAPLPSIAELAIFWQQYYPKLFSKENVSLAGTKSVGPNVQTGTTQTTPESGKPLDRASYNRQDEAVVTGVECMSMSLEQKRSSSFGLTSGADVKEESKQQWPKDSHEPSQALPNQSSLLGSGESISNNRERSDEAACFGHSSCEKPLNMIPGISPLSTGHEYKAQPPQEQKEPCDWDSEDDIQDYIPPAPEKEMAPKSNQDDGSVHTKEVSTSEPAGFLTRSRPRYGPRAVRNSRDPEDTKCQPNMSTRAGGGEQMMITDRQVCIDSGNKDSKGQYGAKKGESEQALSDCNDDEDQKKQPPGDQNRCPSQKTQTAQLQKDNGRRGSDQKGRRRTRHTRKMPSNCKAKGVLQDSKEPTSKTEPGDINDRIAEIREKNRQILQRRKEVEEDIRSALDRGF